MQFYSKQQMLLDYLHHKLDSLSTELKMFNGLQKFVFEEISL